MSLAFGNLHLTGVPSVSWCSEINDRMYGPIASAFVNPAFLAAASVTFLRDRFRFGVVPPVANKTHIEVMLEL